MNLKHLLISAATLLLPLLNVQGTRNVAYIHGDVAENGTLPSGTAAAYDPMLLTDSGNTGCSQFRNLIEAECLVLI